MALIYLLLDLFSPKYFWLNIYLNYRKKYLENVANYTATMKSTESGKNVVSAK